MGRIFDLPAAGRRYSIRVTSIDEGWELWIYEGRRPLMLGGTVAMDAALEAWLAGRDAVAEMAKRIGVDFASGKPPAEGAAARRDPLQSPVP